MHWPKTRRILKHDARNRAANRRTSIVKQAKTFDLKSSWQPATAEHLVEREREPGRSGDSSASGAPSSGATSKLGAFALDRLETLGIVILLRRDWHV